MILSSIIEDKTKDYTQLIESAMEKLTCYINPELFHAEQKYLRTGSLPGERKNVEFERHGKSARATGIPDVSPMLRGALDKFKNLKSNRDRNLEDPIVLMGEDGLELPGPATSFDAAKLPRQVKRFPNDDSETLG